MFTLGRKIDFNYTSNKVILAIAIIVAGIGTFTTGDVRSGLYIGAGTFLTWALAREVDPKHDYSAFVAAGLSLVNIFYYQNIQLFVLFWILLMMRLVSGITGKKPTFLDIFSVLGISIYLSIDAKNITYLVPFMGAMLIMIKAKESSKISTVALAISLGAFLVEGIYFKYLNITSSQVGKILNILVIIAIFIYIIGINFIKVSGLKDDRGRLADEKKIRSSQMLFGNVILILFLFIGVGINNLIIYISAILGIFLYSIIDKKQMDRG